MKSNNQWNGEHIIVTWSLSLEGKASLTFKKEKEKKKKVISTDTEKAIDKIHHPLLVGTLSKLHLEGNLLKLIKPISEKSIIHIIVIN